MSPRQELEAAAAAPTAIVEDPEEEAAMKRQQAAARGRLLAVRLGLSPAYGLSPRSGDGTPRPMTSPNTITPSQLHYTPPSYGAPPALARLVQQQNWAQAESAANRWDRAVRAQRQAAREAVSHLASQLQQAEAELEEIRGSMS